MFFLFPSSFFFLFFMVLGVFVSLSSSNIFLVWCGLEMNLMGFIPLMIQLKNLGEVEAAVKYFLVQSFGSAMILMGGILYFYDVGFFSLGFSVLIFSGLFVKLGVFPFYFWLPSVMISLDWVSCTLIATWQKVAPFGILMTLSHSELSLISFGVMSSLVGGILGMNQVNVKSLLAYSSIGHMGWMISVCKYSMSICMVYLILYLVSNFFIFFLLMKMNFYRMKTIKSVSNMYSFYMILLGFSFLALAGIPPLLGFFPKLLSIEVLLSSHHSVGTFLLVLGTCFSLYYYISLVLNSYSNSYYWNWNKSVLYVNSLGYSLMFLVTINLLSLVMLVMMI
uniref:NADH-ubiquinone oxidoreductase chain 2 n=1 Tax=Loxosomella aloxiata TaxID=393182 RepID=B1B1Y1_9BILA|nr:NADH dehydrogenase subunit 2 [Loxosomella aloxiata]BAG12596.1 NADH dehydrogenase subunit 2 [Loxosomella aloxiata]